MGELSDEEEEEAGEKITASEQRADRLQLDLSPTQRRELTLLNPAQQDRIMRANRRSLLPFTKSMRRSTD